MPEIEEAATDQANEALQQLMHPDEVQEPEAEPAETVAEPPAEEAAPAEPATEAAPAEEAAAAEPTGSDDIESLRKEMGEREERFNAKLQAQHQRQAASEQILRDRFLRKSTALDKARQTLQATRTEGGVSEAEVDGVLRELEGTMHPQSTSYAAPEAVPVANTEEQALVLNSFLNERSMTQEEQDEFGRWIQTEANTVMSPTEQAVANESLSGFLYLAHQRWQEGVQDKEKESTRKDAVGAARSVQRTQREAARAASASTSAPKKQPIEPAAGPDVSKLSKDDISTLLRQSVEHYK